MAGKGILAVIQVDRLQTVQADDAVKTGKHIVQLLHDIGAAVVYMACIQAYTEPVARLARIHDRAQLLKAAEYRIIKTKRCKNAYLIFKIGKLRHSTAPEKYAELEKELPVLSKDRITIQEAILKIQEATARGLQMIKEVELTQEVIALRSLESFEKAADGKATKIIVPSNIQGIAGLASSIVEIANTGKTE